MDLHELAPVGGRATSGRRRWRLERFAKMREDFPDTTALVLTFLAGPVGFLVHMVGRGVLRKTAAVDEPVGAIDVRR